MKNIKSADSVTYSHLTFAEMDTILMAQVKGLWNSTKC